MKGFVFAANWKMNLSLSEVEAFMSEFSQNLKLTDDSRVIIFPPSVFWREVQAGAHANIEWGFQNVHAQESGAFTGEISITMAADLGAQHVLVGHSERRTLFSETDAEIAEKIEAAQKHNLVPMLCLGESLEQREAGQTHDVITDQLSQGLAKANFSCPFMVAYEPVWAIGTGRVATPEQASEAHQVLRNHLVKLMGKEQAQFIPILYGGSVKPDNVQALSQQAEINGFLVGGASLKSESFLKITRLGESS